MPPSPRRSPVANEYEAIRASFERAIADPTGASDGEFCSLMQQAFDRVFAEELAKEVAAAQEQRA